jgi:hypothetical protein
MESLTRDRLEVPQYLRSFRCHVVKQDTPLDIRQRIAGREQARQETVRKQTLSDTIQWFLKEVETVKQRAARDQVPVVISKRDLLKTTYMKTGKTITNDGTIVCHLCVVYATRSNHFTFLYRRTG